jgi:glutamine amidotransferase PdxT
VAFTVPLVEVVKLIIPCILHLENRVGEKIVTSILRHALDDFRGRKDDFIEKMNDVFKRKLFGSDVSPSQWKLPVTKEAKQIKIDHVQVRNNVARCIVKNIDVIIEAARPPERIDLQMELIGAISKYRSAMELLTLHRELTEVECDQFQELIDEF